MLFVSIFLETYGLQIQVILDQELSISNKFVLPQALAIIGICFLGYFLQTRCRPYDDHRFAALNELEKKSLMISGVIIYCGLYFISEQLNSNWNRLLLVFILVGNIWFIVYWAKHFLKSKIHIARRIWRKFTRLPFVQKITTKLSRRFTKTRTFFTKSWRIINKISTINRAGTNIEDFYDGITGEENENDNSGGDSFDANSSGFSSIELSRRENSDPAGKPSQRVAIRTEVKDGDDNEPSN